MLTAPGGYPTASSWAPPGTGRELAGPEDAAAAVAELADQGAAAIKVSLNGEAGPTPSDAELAAIVQAAHVRALPVTAHVQGTGQAERALGAGMDEFAHTPWTERLSDLLLASAARTMRIVSTLDILSFGDVTPELRTACDNLVRFRILGDLGINLRELGAYDAARQCFDMVLASEPSMIIRANTCIELMEMESGRGNRLAFERYRQEARAFEDRMPPSMAIDYRYRIGIGFARFGKEAKARGMLREALGLAEASKLNEWYFRIDRVLRNLALCVEQPEPADSTAHATEMAPAVAQVSAGLREIAAGAMA